MAVCNVNGCSGQMSPVKATVSEEVKEQCLQKTFPLFLFLLPLSPDKKALGIGPKLHIRAKSYLIWNDKCFTLLYAQMLLLEKFVQNVLVNYYLRVSWYVACQINPKKPSSQHGQEVFSCLYVCISFRNHTRMITDGVTGSRIAQR